MYLNKTIIATTANTITANTIGGGGFAVNYYWSSTEYNDNRAWFQSLLTG
tara:strand:- start:111 stop:260 length:150 start_codon:yes stop_codon:yes gene_type:complete